jgi:hypothetical protein
MFKRFFSKKSKKLIPDKPIGFGYKHKWLAIKSTDKNKVAKFLKLKNIQESNWEYGVNFGYEKGVFVTPEIDGWILVLGIEIFDLETDATREFLIRMSTEFGEVQIFLTHRVVEYHFWGLAKEGEIERLYAYIGDSGENLIIEGEPTKVEKKYNFINTLSKEAESDEYWEREDLEFPNEEIVMEIAEAWSINPTKIETMQNIEGIGLIGK